MATKTATAPKDDRLFIRITLDFFDSEKVFPLSPGAKLAFIEMIAWSARQHTDGRIRKRLALARWTPGIVEELLDSDPERPLLVEGENDYFIHDYAEHQQTTADIEAVREARRAAGRKGGLAKAAAQKGVSSKKVAKASKPLAKPAEKENEKENYKKKGERKTRTTVAAPVALCPVPDAPSPSPQIEIGLAPDGVAPATAADHPAGPEPQGEPVGAPRPVAVDPQPAVEPAPAPVLEDPWAGLPDLADHQTAQASDTDCADSRMPSCLNPTGEKTMTAKDQAVVAAVRAYQVIGTPAEWSSPDDPRCRKHAYLPREEVPPCRNCMRARQWFDQRAVAEKQAHLAAIHACPLCDERGFVEVKSATGKTVVAHCDHTGELPKPKAETQPRLTGRGMPAHLREKLDSILGRQTAQETAPEAPQKPETRGAHTDTLNHDPNPAEERSGELVAVGAAS
jgi:hypothetical protein